MTSTLFSHTMHGKSWVLLNCIGECDEEEATSGNHEECWEGEDDTGPCPDYFCDSCKLGLTSDFSWNCMHPIGEIYFWNLQIDIAWGSLEWADKVTGLGGQL